MAEEEVWQLNKEAIEKEAQYDRFYAVVTNLEADIQEIITINQRRWQIEAYFRIMKTEFDAKSIYLKDDERLKAHFLICFMALLFFRIIESKLDYKYMNN